MSLVPRGYVPISIMLYIYTHVTHRHTVHTPEVVYLICYSGLTHCAVSRTSCHLFASLPQIYRI